ncbi:putative inorganic carbon transporter subunit DabA [Tundrisphaera sp. TA3]|uniref:putative inorganic carbon transporter subunit DabA n=1 Tax=Tundrisphaera sp. TA3 TaxID=3435775 RepID=UPI003EBB7DEE
MFEVLETGSEATTAGIADDVARVCRRIPPLWDLTNYVAVNPFLGFASRPIGEAAREISEGLGAHVLPRVDYYRERWQAEEFGPADLALAADRAGLSASALVEVLEGRAEPKLRPSGELSSFAEQFDRRHGTGWDDAVIRYIARWCADHASGGGPSWKIVGDAGLYQSWRESALVDRSLEVAGLVGWRRWTRALPDRAEEAIEAMLERHRVTPALREPYLYRLLAGVYGWASFLRRASWQEGDETCRDVAGLLAVRVCCDAAVAELARPGGAAPSRPFRLPVPTRQVVEDEAERLAIQDAMEVAYTRRLLGRIPPAPAPEEPPARPAVQAVFCIDVRSEPLRRHLEALDPGIDTFGFAGFFGVPMEWQDGGKGTARCPALLQPSYRLGPAEPTPPANVKGVLKPLQSAPGAAFTLVETLGLAYGYSMIRDALGLVPTIARRDEESARFDLAPDGLGRGFTPEARLDLACSILKNLGLRGRIARVVLLCGHRASATNNSHVAGLNCGACGGHGGAINARVAAAILNDPDVRAGLPARGHRVPDDTVFIAGVHNTTIDEFTVLDPEGIPNGHRAEVERLGRWMADACASVRHERAESLGVADGDPSLLERLLRRRSRDWSEVRPEWGLARNASFIAARRARTRGVDLHGRAFLHAYDASTDADGSVLKQILSAPVVVGAWINLQYFASTVDNRVFGCGTKALHNRLGTIGVVVGNGGDLRTGLPMQSVHSADGRWFHEPLRLQVIVEAGPDKLDEALASLPAVLDLVENGWMRLYALDPAGGGASFRSPGRGWEPVAEGAIPAARPGPDRGQAPA